MFYSFNFFLWQTDKQGLHRVVRFEKSGATALENFNFAILRSSNLSAIDPCNLELIRGHLFVALLIHVRGFGKRAVARSRATSG